MKLLLSELSVRRLGNSAAVQLTALWSSDVQSTSKRFDKKRTFNVLKVIVVRNIFQQRDLISEVKFTIAVKNTLVNSR